MALQAELEELLKVMDPADAEAQRKLFEKHQSLREGYLRQADYSRKVAEAADQKKVAEAEWKKAQDWWKTEKPKHDKLVEEYTTLEKSSKTTQTELTEVREKLQKFEAGELDVDEATLDAAVDKRIKGMGYVTDSDMRRIVTEEATKLAESIAEKKADEKVNAKTTQFLTETWPAAQAINQQMIRISNRHFHKYGKDLTDEDEGKIAQIMKDDNILDPQKAYDKFMEPVARKMEIDAEVKKCLIEERSKFTGFPGVTGQPGGEFGVMQSRAAHEKPVLPEGTKVGDMTGATMAAAELAAEGKF